MSTKSNAVKDIRFEASTGIYRSAVASPMSKRQGYLGLVLSSPEIYISEVSSNRNAILRACWEQHDPFLMLSGEESKLQGYLKSVLDKCQGSTNESEEALNVLLGFEDIHAVEHRFPVEATPEPSPLNYPSNISEEGKEVWKKVLESDRYKMNVRGRSMQVRWAIAMKMYMDKALREGAKPFAASLDRYSKKTLTDSYNNTLTLATSFEEQLHSNAFDRSFISEESTDWRFKEVSYNDGKFVCVLEKLWFLHVPRKKLLRHLIVNEGFKKNTKGAGFIYSISPNARIRIRTRSNTVEVALFVLFGKDKLVHSFLIDKSLKTKDMLNEFHTVVKRWFKFKRF